MFPKSKTITTVFLFLSSFVGYSQVSILLRKTFIDSLKNRVTISSEFMVVKSHENPNPAKADGDFHFAGNDRIIGLPVVAEIMNAKDASGAFSLVKNKINKKIAITGVWRLWCEHGSKSVKQDQGGKFPKISNSNPAHVFEIHPVTIVEGTDLLKTFKPISGYTGLKKAEKAFSEFSKKTYSISDKGEKVQIITKNIGNNYVDFIIQPISNDQKIVADGRFLDCLVLSTKDKVLNGNQPVRMVFLKDSEAEKRAQSLKKGDKLRVIGIPRINLTLLQNLRPENEGKLFPLPIEMIIVALN